MFQNDLQRTDIVETLFKSFFHMFTNAMTILPMYMYHRHSILGAYAVPNFKIYAYKYLVLYK